MNQKRIVNKAIFALVEKRNLLLEVLKNEDIFNWPLPPWLQFIAMKSVVQNINSATSILLLLRVTGITYA